jgi:DNA invertase Pin-like site-specific DNA recombinase
MKCALYACVNNRDKGQDARNQLQQLRAHCEKQGWKITGEQLGDGSGH